MWSAMSAVIDIILEQLKMVGSLGSTAMIARALALFSGTGFAVFCNTGTIVAPFHTCKASLKGDFPTGEENKISPAPQETDLYEFKR